MTAFRLISLQQLQPGNIWSVKNQLVGFKNAQKPWHYSLIFSYEIINVIVLSITSKKKGENHGFKTCLGQNTLFGRFDNRNSYILYRGQIVARKSFYDSDLTSYSDQMKQDEFAKLKAAYKNRLEKNRPVK